MLTLASVFGFFWGFLLFLFVLVAIFLIMLVLIQKGRGGGLASAFGGASGHTPFGTKTGDVLTWATSIVFGIFLVLAVILNLMANHRHALGLQQAQQQAAPAAPAAAPQVPPPGPAPAPQ